MSLSAVKSRLMFAKDNLQSNRLDDVEQLLNAAEGFLKACTPDEQATYGAQLQEVRTQLDGTLRSDDQRFLTGAKLDVQKARGQMEQRLGAADIEMTLARAEELLAKIPDKFAAHKAPFQADIAAIRAQLNGVPTPAAPPPLAPAPVAASGPVLAVAAPSPADANALDALKFAIESLQRAAKRDLDAFQGSRTQTRPKDLDPSALIQKLGDYAARIKGTLDPARPQLTSDKGKALAAEVDAWLSTTAAQIADLAHAGAAFALFRGEVEVEEIGRIGFLAALDSVEWNFGRQPERVVLAWDAAKKLLPTFESPQFSDVPEIVAAIERYRGLERRVATELRPLLAKLRVGPLVESATYWLNLLKRDIDERAEDSVLKWRKGLRDALLPLERDWSDNADAQDFIAKAQRAFRRSEDELGDGIVRREIEAAEVFVLPLTDRVERALALGSASRLREHAPRLSARLSLLVPLLSHQRAKLLDDRARAALARIATVGEAVAREVAEAEAVPQFAIDFTMDTGVQAVLGKINRAFASYQEEYLKAQEAFEAEVDVIAGTAGYGAFRTVESATSTMIRAARSAENATDELRRIDRNHPAIAAVETAVPRLVKRAQAWKDRLGQKYVYAQAIGSIRSAAGDAEGRRDLAVKSEAGHAITFWPETLDRLANADTAVAGAIAAVPDEHDEADDWAAKVAGLRKEAIETLSALCLREASRLAVAGDGGARMYADALAKAVPDAPENAQIAAAIAGTADARQKAQSEIELRGQLIRKRAEEAAAAARPSYDAWVASKSVVKPLAGSIVANIDAFRGKWIAAYQNHLGLFLGDEAYELDGDIFEFDYDPEVRAQLAAGMKKMDGLYAAMVEHVSAAHGIGGISTFTQHYPRGANYLCEIVGVTQHTPRREIRDSYGRILGTIDGIPYPVPRLVIRGVGSLYFTVVPGHAPSIDAMNVAGLAD